ncbi:hypothetical protein BHE74_00018703 [Ensete ventricosum]|nr:hypothetical protein BHE74_00018703 [Ensete ventricosum]
MSSSLWSHSGEEGGSDQVSESRVKRRRQWQRDGDDDSGRGGRWGRQQRGAGCWQQRQAVGRRGRRGDGDAVAWLCRGIGGLGSGREKKMEEATVSHKHDSSRGGCHQGAEHPRQPSVASSTLVELTTRLDFFKERRSQLMEQLHSLDLSHGASSQSLAYKSSPPWNDPR